MSCPECDGERRRLPLPDALAAHEPGEGEAVVACTTCLRTWAPGETPEVPDGEGRAISNALPADETAAVALVLAVSLLSSVARNQAALESLFDVVERTGSDPRLALERLAEDPDLAPAVDLRRRLRQFEGLR